MYLPTNRYWSRRIAIIMIAAGILLLPDIIAPTPMMDVLLNLPLAMVIADIGGMSFTNAVMVTFGIAFILLLAGLLVYPYNTKRLMVGRLKMAMTWMLANPLLLVISIIIFIMLYWWGGIFYDTYYQSVKSYVEGALVPLITNG